MKYKIIGDSLPAVICDIEPGECLITERGSMSWMTPNMKFETTTGGGIGRALGRMLSGDSMFLNRYYAEGGPGQITFASSFPGSICVFEITPENPIVVQKSAFLAAESTVELSLHFQRKLGAGLFGGEGFIMQKLSGSGTAFIEIDGCACEYELAEGQAMVVDTGYLAAMSASCTMDIVTVPGVKNMLFGGEGLFHTVVRGPGRIILQTMPISAVAASLQTFFPSSK